MNSKRSILRATLYLAAMVVSLLIADVARAQIISPQFVGKFTLTSPVRWGKGTLPPGTYTLRIHPVSLPVIATVYNDRDAVVATVMTGVKEDYTSGTNALHLKIKNGQTVVQSLVLADLNTVLVFDPSPKRERVEEAKAAPSFSVLVARK